MRALLISILLFLSASILSALLPQLSTAQLQNSSSAPEPSRSGKADGKPALTPKAGVFQSALGFSYSYSNDWISLNNTKLFEALNRMNELLPKKEKENSRKGLATRATECRQMVMMLALPKPRSGAVVITAIPSDCVGRTLAEKDLPVLQSLASQNATSALDVTSVRAGNYMLGSHNVWIKRFLGTPKGQPRKPTTAELVCALPAKAFVCWSAVVGNEEELKAFEYGAVTLDGDSAPALVPPAAIASLKN
jgi:hypothetical protein